MNKYAVIKLGDSGWYDFKELPQGYIKVHGLRCGSDRKAINQANKILAGVGVVGQPVIVHKQL